jgi:RimJ/RimL family protein N-acetyltransferase/catechol 2,3-dioxygenase-like lactoylglutathione lyase family enzyme
MQTLTTSRLDLVQLDPGRDAESLHAMFDDPEMLRYSRGTLLTDVTATRAQLADELAGNGGWTWVIRLRPADLAIGTVGLFYDQGTSIRGLDWRLRRDHWGRGIMSEAVRAAVAHLLAQPGIDGVEAWIDSQNTRSLGVARHAGLDERARLPRVYGDRVAQSVVMVRSAIPRDPDTLVMLPSLRVRDIESSIAMLTSILGLHELFRVGEPPNYARLGIAHWSGSPSLQVSAADGDIAPVDLAVDIGISIDVVYERAVTAGVSILEPVTERPWGRTVFAFALPEGHCVRVSGPGRPANS